MTDVVKIALDRRAELHEEVARIDEFIRMADILLRKANPGDEDAEPADRDPGLPREVQDAFREPPTVIPAEAASGNGAGASTGITRMNLMRRGPAAVGS